MLGLVVLTVHRIVDVWRHDLSSNSCIAAVQLLTAMQVRLPSNYPPVDSDAVLVVKGKLCVLDLYLGVEFSLLVLSVHSCYATM